MSKNKVEDIKKQAETVDKLQVELPSKIKPKAKEIEVAVEVINSKAEANQPQSSGRPKEINGPKGLEPTRYGDWESKGRCYDF